MQAPGFLQKYRIKIAVALLLTFVAGLVDITGYLGIYQMFTAHMTGTTVQLAHNAILGNWAAAFSAATVIISFFFGSVFGRAVIQIGSRRRIRRIATVTLILEAVLVLGAGYCATYLRGMNHPTSDSALERHLLLAILAASMGLQTATLTGIGPLTVHTTFVTGMINKLAQFVSRLAFYDYDVRLGQSPSAESQLARRNDAQQALLLLLIWFAYLGGALAGSWNYETWGLRILYLAGALLLLTVGVDQVFPLSIEEEKEQSES